MTSRPPPAALATRLLTEQLRRKEEALGHALTSPEADATAINAGGALLARIQARALAMPGADVERQHLQQLLQLGRGLAVAALLLALSAGFAVASSALNASRPASLPLVLASLVGINLLSLMLWIILQAGRNPASATLSRLYRWAWQRLERHLPPPPDATDTHRTSAVDMIVTSVGGRWLAGTLVHALWLAFTVGSLLALALLLSVRAYMLSWETTLLAPQALRFWAELLSWGPALLGITTPALPQTPTVTDAAQLQAWSQWLLAAVLVYGALPRAVALAGCALALRSRLRAFGSDVAAPGYARLRARLMPDHRALGVIDAAPPEAPVLESVKKAPQPLAGVVHGLHLEGADGTSAPPLPDVQWRWLGSVDDASSRAAAIAELRRDAARQLAIVVPATTTPDRGIERYTRDLMAEITGPTRVLVADVATLRTRSADAGQQRLRDWQALARRIGADFEVLPEPEQP